MKRSANKRDVIASLSILTIAFSLATISAIAQPFNGWRGPNRDGIYPETGLLYCYEERRGTVALVKPNPDKFDIISNFRITQGGGAHWAHPVIVDGKLYIRHGEAMMVYKIK